jgi:23S rRNA (adenine2030-N6)-methyltransferase
MLSYQHAYHAGNLADVQKHAALAWVLDYLTQKPKPLTYIETHAGRGLYDLAGAEAAKTGEAAGGIGRLVLPQAHPYARALAETRRRYGAQAYPGSPMIAALLLRHIDSLHLAELHPQEHAALHAALTPLGAQVHRAEGLAFALARTPPVPRRGLLLMDPSYEVKDDYEAVPRTLLALHRKWNVGILMLWYPILDGAPHRPMVAQITRAVPEALVAEVRFPPLRAGHRMEGSGLLTINPPWGMAEALKEIAAWIAH